MHSKSPNQKSIGVVFPDEGAFEYELIDNLFMKNWLAKHGLEHIGYCLERTPGGKASSLEACAELERDDYVLPASRRLAQAGADVIVWGCVSASAYRGLDYAHQQAAKMSSEAKRPATSGALAMLAAVQSLGATTVDIMMAYMPEVAEKFVEFFSQANIKVADVKHMVCKPKQRSFDLDYKEELSEFVNGVSLRKHPILIPSTSLNSLDAVEEFERIAGRSVITANQACIWHALQLVGSNDVVHGAGSVFSRTA